MITEKAQDLGRLLGQTDEYKALKRAHERVAERADLQEKMNRMGALAQELEIAAQSGAEPPKEKIVEYDTLMSSIQADSSYQQVVAAQSNFDKLMTKVNEQIMDGIKKGAASPIITLT